jgi:hypothetical protein
MLRPLPVLTALAAFAGLLGAATPASAQWRGDRVTNLVDADVTFVTSAQIEGQRYRAVVLETRHDALLLLEVADPYNRRRPAAQVRVASLALGPTRYDTLNASDFRDLRFGRAALHFETTLRHGDVRCRVPLRRFDPRDRVIEAVCEDLTPPRVVVAPPDRPMAVPPAPHHPQHPQRPQRPPQPPGFEAEIVASCHRHVMGQGQTDACIRAARAIGPAGAATIDACARQTVGGPNLVACLEAVGHPHPLAAELVGACAEATIGPTAWLGCIRTASASRYDPLPVIRECREVTVGNEALQRCLAASLR